MTRQYVVVRFGVKASPTYTYHNDGEAVRTGDEVMVPGRKGGPMRVTVVGVSLVQPLGFVTKPIDGLAPPKEE